MGGLLDRGLEHSVNSLLCRTRLGLGPENAMANGGGFICEMCYRSCFGQIARKAETGVSDRSVQTFPSSMW